MVRITTDESLLERRQEIDVGYKEPVTLLEVLDRILDKGIVIVGDVVLSIGGVDLLTLKLRLLIASVDTAKKLGVAIPIGNFEEERIREKIRGELMEEMKDELKETMREEIRKELGSRRGRKVAVETEQQDEETERERLRKRGKKVAVTAT